MVLQGPALVWAEVTCRRLNVDIRLKAMHEGAHAVAILIHAVPTVHGESHSRYSSHDGSTAPVYAKLISLHGCTEHLSLAMQVMMQAGNSVVVCRSSSSAKCWAAG